MGRTDFFILKPKLVVSGQAEKYFVLARVEL